MKGAENVSFERYTKGGERKEGDGEEEERKRDTQTTRLLLSFDPLYVTF